MWRPNFDQPNQSLSQKPICAESNAPKPPKPPIKNYHKKNSVNSRLAKYGDVPVVPQLEAMDVVRDQNCICLRPRSLIKCQICGHLFHGRISEMCVDHPDTGYLMDALYCVKCTAPLQYLEKR